MKDIVDTLSAGLSSFKSGITEALSERNRQVTFAVLIGGATIAAANWIAMSRPENEAVFGLGHGSASGALFAPLYGGLVTGAVAGFSRRPVYADARAGTFAAFTGMIFLMALVTFTRFTSDLPATSEGFENLGPVSAILFVVVIGAANVFITFPTAFLVMFTSRSLIPNNKHRYGWLNTEDDDNPGLVPLTAVVRSNSTDYSQHSTAFSRFSQSPPRFSRVPGHFLDVKPE